MSSRDLADDGERRLRAAGLRSTSQRRAVLDAVDRLGHATVDELAALVQRELPDVSLSTVYRTVQSLEKVGLVTHTHLHHGAPTYHSVGGDPHIHLVCAQCGRVDQAPARVAGELADEVRAAVGFYVDLAHLTLHGRCDRCGPGSPDELSALLQS